MAFLLCHHFLLLLSQAGWGASSRPLSTLRYPWPQTLSLWVAIICESSAVSSCGQGCCVIPIGISSSTTVLGTERDFSHVCWIAWNCGVPGKNIMTFRIKLWHWKWGNINLCSCPTRVMPLHDVRVIYTAGSKSARPWKSIFCIWLALVEAPFHADWPRLSIRHCQLDCGERIQI